MSAEWQEAPLSEEPDEGSSEGEASDKTLEVSSLVSPSTAVFGVPSVSSSSPVAWVASAGAQEQQVLGSDDGKDLIERRCQFSAIASTTGDSASPSMRTSLKVVVVFSGASSASDFIDQALSLEGFRDDAVERISVFGETAAAVLDPSVWDSTRQRLTADGKQVSIITPPCLVLKKYALRDVGS